MRPRADTKVQNFSLRPAGIHAGSDAITRRWGSLGQACGRRKVVALIAELSRHSPLSLAMAKRVLNTVYDGPLHVGLELEGLAFGLLQQTHDFHEGVKAFVEKRKPEFDGT